MLGRNMNIKQRYYYIGIRGIYLLVPEISYVGVGIKKAGLPVLQDEMSPTRILQELV